MKNAIRDIIAQAEKMRNAYFWSPPQNAAGRRNYEQYNSREKIEWVDGRDTYTAEYIVDCSCRNIYAHGEYTKNGKKTTLTAIKNSLKRLEATASAA